MQLASTLRYLACFKDMASACALLSIGLGGIFKDNGKRAQAETNSNVVNTKDTDTQVEQQVRQNILVRQSATRFSGQELSVTRE